MDVPPITPPIVNEPRPIRYPGAPGKNVLIQVTRDNGETVPAEIVDVSLGGLKLRVASSMRFQEAVTVQFSIAEPSWQMCLPAEVRWVRARTQGEWRLGCAFRQQLSPAKLENLFQRGIVERRKFKRYPIQGSATAKPELAEDSVRVELHDFSDGGFRILTQRPVRNGRLLLQLKSSDGGEIHVRANVQWRRQLGHQTLIGCEFIDKHDHHLMRDAVCPASAELPRVAPRRRRLTVALALFLVAAIVWGLEPYWAPVAWQVISLKPKAPSATWPWQVDLPWRPRTPIAE